MLFFFFVSSLIVFMTHVVHGAKWTYAGPHGEHFWSKQYPFCGGAFQSPIDIQTDLLRFDPTLRPIEVRNYNLSTDEQLTLGNNGHSVQLSLPSRMHLSGLPHHYTAAQLHFHWGSSRLPAGSEHTVNGKQFAAEMHVVHFNSDKYANISMAVDKSDGLAVLGVLIEIGEFNPAFDQLLKYINGIKYKDQRVQVAGFNIRSLLPARLDEYYRYDGSLTTPPCYPSVLWTVFRSPVSLSVKQFQALATAIYASGSQDSNPVPLHGNYRKPQLSNNRVVLVSFKEGRGLYGMITVTSPILRRQTIQQLQLGDLADLADDGLQQLLPKLRQKPQAGNAWKNHKPSRDQTGFEEQGLKFKVNGDTVFSSSPWKYTQAGRYGAGLNEDAMCYVSLEQKVFHQLRRTHTEAHLVQALREVMFPQLNFRSYLHGRSDLALPTIRLILSGRPTDEAFELDRSLTKAYVGQRKSAAEQKPSLALTKYSSLSVATVPERPHSPVQPYLWIQPMEWED
ncbi:carbonic anhydrase 12 [Hypomesus transpacificus]|uniref:carbonic anhydrase 12 n=1 Tax=Hypomesus transpacificus TaxID=137520 RepID=UPI001F085D52|nr:carbonic anhydrase 12 [Hypomesus transpacificus]